MKKIYLLFIALLFLKASFATTHIIQVSNNQFSPATVNVVVGDVIEWDWVEGFHTTTSVTIPSGATAWNQQLNQGGVTTFSYTVTKAGTYNYECQFHAPAMVGTINVSGALPVVLSSFNISPAKAGAMVAWTTATEQNTDHFEIMRSTDGKSFEKITTVTAKGNSATVTNYSYIDNRLPGNNQYVYYYLSIVDKDGKRSASGIKTFQNTSALRKLVTSLSPNPISKQGHLMLQFNSEKTNTLHVQLFDASGKLVKQADMNAVPGLNNGHFHIGDVAPGTYTIIFTMDAQKEIYKVVVQ